MPSDSLQPFKQSVVRSLRHAWSTLTKKDLDDETKFDPFASTWFLADKEAIDRNLEGFTDLTRRSAPVTSSSLDSLGDILSTSESQFPLSQCLEEFPDELTSFLPSFDSPPSSPRSSTSHEAHSLDSNQIMYPSSEAGYPRDRSPRGSLFLDLTGNSFNYSNPSSKTSQSAHIPRFELSTPNVTSNDSYKKVNSFH